MGESLTEQRRVREEGLRVVNLFSQGGRSDVGNFQWSGEMRRYWKEHQKRRHLTGPLLTLTDES
eukprot:gene23489-gene11135